MKKIFRPLNILKTLVLTMLFFSCSNFTESGDFKDEFDKEVSFANAPEIHVKVFSEKADTLPSGISQRKHGEEFSVYCNPFPDFQFVRWQVKNLSTGEFYSEEELKSIASFENPEDSETMCTIVVPENEIQIEPLCVERPHVLSEAPIFNNQGNYRDASIMVMFDHPLDEGSIYYTSEELKALRLNNERFYTRSEYRPETEDYFLYRNPKESLTVDNVTYEDQVYGYKKNGKLYFKNIEISDSLSIGTTKKSLLDCFDGPYISGLYLLIPTYKGDALNENIPLANPPAPGTQIQVDISPDVFYTSDNADIKLNVAKKWIYNVGTLTDTIAPEITCKVFDSAGKEFSGSYGTTKYTKPTYDNFVNIPKLKDGKLKLYAKAIDSASGPSSDFSISLTQISNYKYEEISNPQSNNPLSRIIPYTTLTSNQSYFGTETEPTEIQFSDIPQGIFEMTLKFTDMNGNPTETSKYYFAMDKTPVVLVEDPIISSDTTSTVTSFVAFSWKNPTDVDYDHMVIKYKKLSEADSDYKEKTCTRTETTKTITGLTSTDAYIFNFDFYDAAGNKATSNSYTLPPQFTNFTLSKDASYPTQRIKLDWDYPTSPAYSGVLFYYGTSTFENSLGDYNCFVNTATKTVSIPKSKYLAPGTDYKIYAVTHYGKVPSYFSDVTKKTTRNTSIPYVKTFTTQPNPVTNLQSSSTTTSVTLSWTNPTSGNWTGHKIYYKKSSASSYTVVTNPTKTTTSYTISELDAATSYDFKVETYATDKTNISTSATKSTYTLANPVTSLTASPYSSTGSSYNKTYIKLSWTNPTSGGGVKKVLYYKASTASSWTTKDVTDYSSTTVSGLSAGTLYYFYISSYSDSAGTVYINTSTITWGTAPATVTNVSRYNDNGQGRLKFKWTTPNSTLYTGTKIYVFKTPYSDPVANAAYAANVIDVQGARNTVTYNTAFDVKDYKRSDKLYFYFVTYNNYSSSEPVYANGSSYDSAYSNSKGWMTIKGTIYNYSIMKNVTTSDKKVIANTTRTGGAFTNGRDITLTPYSIGAYEVTNDIYTAVMGSTPSQKNTGSTYPVDSVNWYQAIAFCNRLSKLFDLDICYEVSGITNWETAIPPTTANANWDNAISYLNRKGYHLPTEAQWEFAARGGRGPGYGEWSYTYAGTNVGDYSWYSSNSSNTTHTVGGKEANRLGLYDMTGNVWEWISDWNNDVPNGTYTDPYCDFTYYRTDPSSIAKKEEKVLLKGGAYDCSTSKAYLEVDYNSEKNDPEIKKNNYGFRICRNVTCN